LRRHWGSAVVRLASDLGTIELYTLGHLLLTARNATGGKAASGARSDTAKGSLGNHDSWADDLLLCDDLLRGASDAAGSTIRVSALATHSIKGVARQSCVDKASVKASVDGRHASDTTTNGSTIGIVVLNCDSVEHALSIAAGILSAHSSDKAEGEDDLHHYS